MAKVTKAVGRRRLAVLARFLRRFRPSKKRKYDQSVYYETNCKDSACALGWATTIPAFRRAGLTLIPDPDVLPGGKFRIFLPKFRRRTGIDAGTSFFGISPSVADDLFGMFPPCTEKGKAEQIERYLKDHSNADSSGYRGHRASK